LGEIKDSFSRVELKGRLEGEIFCVDIGEIRVEFGYIEIGRYGEVQCGIVSVCVCCKDGRFPMRQLDIRDSCR